MNTVFASGVQAFQAATARLDAAAGVVNRVQPSTIPAALSQSASAPDASAGGSVAPPPPAGPGGRVPSFSDDMVEAQVQMITASQEASLAATSIRVADEMMGELLDISA
jgi:hypothetical protein